MSRPSIARFEVIPRRRRSEPLVPTLRRCSNQFKKQHAAGDQGAMRATSHKAWETMTNLFDVLRNEQDHGHLPAGYMEVETAKIVTDLKPGEREKMIDARKLDRTHPNFGAVSLRDTLNKIAHFDTGFATYRLDARRAHYLILSGRDLNPNKGPWVAEILVSRLCDNAQKAVKAIT